MYTRTWDYAANVYPNVYPKKLIKRDSADLNTYASKCYFSCKYYAYSLLMNIFMFAYMNHM